MPHGCSQARSWAGCRAPWPRSPSCCSSAPRAAATRLAGGLAAVYGVANAVGQPLLGRAVDLLGQPRVQLPAALVSALAMVLFAVVGTGPLALAYAAVVIAGCSPRRWRAGCGRCGPRAAAARTRCRRRTRMDAVAQEVMFTVGPLLVTLCVSLWSAAAALLVINAIGVLRRALRGRCRRPSRGLALRAARGALARRPALPRAARPARRVPLRRYRPRLHHGRRRRLRRRPRRRTRSTGG